MAIDYPALKTELQTDPKSLGYAPFLAAGNNNALANILNEPRDSSSGTGDPDYEVTVNGVRARDAIKAIVPAEYAALTQAKRDGWRDILVLAQIEGGLIPNTDTDIRSFIQDIWATTVTLGNLALLETRDGSRAEALFGADTVVDDDDIVMAMAS
jgi:hypothetical protein